jgi:UDP-N-acetylmuramoylalanine--D-glutamate ligase
MAIAHVIGLGKSGLAAAQLLNQQGWQVIVHDRGDNASLRQQQQDLATQGIPVELGQPYDPDQLQPAPNLIVVSPGVKWDLPGLVRSRSMGIEVIGEMALAWRNLKTIPWVGITGTNGKTTTTALTAAIFQAAGLDAPACGNIGYAACELRTPNSVGVASPKEKLRTPNSSWVIAELSSYQIESSPEIAPQIGLWTTFTPDHLERHYTLKNYADIKAHLLSQSRWQVLNGDDPQVREIGLARFPEAIWTSTIGPGGLPANADQGVYLEEGWVKWRNQKILEAAALKMVGSHNQQNLLLAVAAALLAGIEPEAIAQGVAVFPGVPHRLELVGTWQEIEFINDSKATNYDAAEVGLAAVKAPVILIAGGQAKAGDDRGWLAQIQAKAAAVVLIGSAAETFAERLRAVGYAPVEILGTMERAVARSLLLANDLGAAVVLLSPACASFDQYANFEQRGDHFRQVCLNLLTAGEMYGKASS